MRKFELLNECNEKLRIDNSYMYVYKWYPELRLDEWMHELIKWAIKTGWMIAWMKLNNWIDLTIEQSLYTQGLHQGICKIHCTFT